MSDASERKMNMVEARRDLTRLPEELSAAPATVTVTRRGKPVLAIMTWDDYDVQAGKTLAWDDARTKL